VKLTRVLGLFLACVAAGAVVAAVGQRLFESSGSGYQVRAVFDNSSFVIPGEQVKVAGVVVGKIGAVQLTRQNHAAVVLDITDRRFTPFHADAHCEIDLQSLLGEQYVQCEPSAPGSPGSGPSPVLPAIGSGPNAGQHLLPVTDTTTPIGFDLLQDIYQLPERQGLQLIVSGLGAGLAGNGRELNQALVRADPALQATNRVISVLARQDRTLASLTDDSARVLGPLAAQSRHIGGFIKHAGGVAAASAQQSQAIEQNLKDFPAFLRQLKPATERLANLANQITPTLQTLNSRARVINAALKGLGPLAKSSIPALRTFGKAAAEGEKAFPRANAEIRQLLTLSTRLKPLATNLSTTAKSFDNAGGIEDLLRFIYYYTGAVNGEDALGHYLRALLEIGACSARSPTPVPGCGATFVKGLGGSGNTTQANGSSGKGSVTRKAAVAAAQITEIANEAVSKMTAKTNGKGPDLAALSNYLGGGR